MSAVCGQKSQDGSHLGNAASQLGGATFQAEWREFEEEDKSQREGTAPPWEFLENLLNGARRLLELGQMYLFIHRMYRLPILPV